MLNRQAEESFDRGLAAVEERRWTEATAFFEAAVEVERRMGNRKPQARYLSYYGLCLAHSGNQRHDAISLCRQAAEIETFNPDLRLNLGRVLLQAGRKREAFKAFASGLRQEPSHEALRQEIRRMGVRKKPVLRFLPRNNPVNILLGRLRAR